MHAFFRALIMAGCCLLFPACKAAAFNYLYIEASEGNSSGGHAAVQFGNEIYHFQHLDSGLIRLFRRETEDFHFLYRYLQNRPIHLSRIDVTEETFELLKHYFKREFLNQERLFRLLDDLHEDRIFLKFLLQNSTAGHARKNNKAQSALRLKGVGLFYPERTEGFKATGGRAMKHQSLSIERLRRTVARHYGPDFLLRRRKQIAMQIKTLVPIDWPAVSEHSAGDKFPPPVYLFADNYADKLTALFAIDALIEARPLRDGVMLQIREAPLKLSNTEKDVLEKWQKRLETTFVESLNSARPDWGYAVLVNLARYLAVDESLRSGYWTFIDDFADNSDRIVPSDYLGQISRMRVLINDVQVNLHRLRQTLVNKGLTEAGYSRLEMAANRYFELLKTERAVEIRFNGEKALPVKTIAFPEDGPFPELREERLVLALSRLEAFTNNLFDRLKEDYRYDLITRNCVTELFRTIDRALLTNARIKNDSSKPDQLAAAESEKKLGGHVDAAFNFIPFVSEQSVREKYRVSLTRDLDSYRELELTKLMTGRNKLLTALKESNTVSSRLYRYNPEDSFFLFFTDNNLPLRPVFGLFNTAAGIGQSLFGLFSWPFDSGKNLKLGTTGILMSLPELVFFNMRKGSYRYLSPKLMANTGVTGF